MLYETGASTAHVEPVRWRKRVNCPFGGLPHSFCLCHLTLLSFTFPDGFTLLYCADIIRAPSDYRILHLVLDIIIFPQLTNDCESNLGKISN